MPDRDVDLGNVPLSAAAEQMNLKMLTVDDAKWLLNLPTYKFNYKKIDGEGNFIDEADPHIEYGYKIAEVEKYNKNIVGYKRKRGKVIEEKIKIEKRDKNNNIITKRIKKEIITKRQRKTNKFLWIFPRRKKAQKKYVFVDVPVFETQIIKREILPVDRAGKEIIEDDLSKPYLIKNNNIVPHLVVLIQDLYAQIKKLKAND
jgi:hypothetical protein